MSKQTVNRGTVANDGTGDQIRVAFGKVGDNFDELYAGSNPEIAPPNALGALAIDTSKRVNTKSISADSTFTFSGAPSAGGRFSLLVTNTDVDSGKTLTIPTCYSTSRRANVTTIFLPLNSIRLISWYYTGSFYVLEDGDPIGVIATDYTVSIGKSAGGTLNPEFAVNIGYQAGAGAPALGQCVNIGYGAGSAGYAGVAIGFAAGGGAGTAAVAVGYSAMRSLVTGGTGNVAIGVHAMEGIGSATGTIGIGYHTLNNGTGDVTNTVAIGDHCAASGDMGYSVFIGAATAIGRPNTLSIDGMMGANPGRNPMLYGEFDNRKFSVAGSGLFEPAAATNNAAVASAALEVKSTSKGFLLPRMTKTQRDAISSPATGLAIFQTDNTPGLRVYNGTNWIKFTESTD